MKIKIANVASAIMVAVAASANSHALAQQTFDVQTASIAPGGALRLGITNLTPGSRPFDAVNYYQSYGGDQLLEQRINRVESSANQGVAAAAAMLTTIRTPDPGKSTVSIGGGYYGRQAASAVSIAHRSRNGKLQGVASIGIPASMESGANIAAAGAVGWQF